MCISQNILLYIVALFSFSFVTPSPPQKKILRPLDLFDLISVLLSTHVEMVNGLPYLSRGERGTDIKLKTEINMTDANMYVPKRAL